MLTRREALTAAALGAAALVTEAPAAWAHDHAVPGVRGMDHVGITVPDIAEARAWFEDVIGCVTPLQFGPFSDPTGTFMQDLLEVHPRAVIPEINVLRCGTGSNIELFEYEAPTRTSGSQGIRDFSGHHLAFYVEDIDVAVAYMESKGVRKFLGPFPVTGGPGGRPVDQLLPGAVRDVRRADLLPGRHGVREDREAQALERARHRREGHRHAGSPGSSASTMSVSPSRTSSSRGGGSRRTWAAVSPAALRPDLRSGGHAHAATSSMSTQEP